MKTKSNKNVQFRAAQPRHLVHFEYDAPNACSVCIAGTFNDWHPTVSEMLNVGNGRWVKDLELPPGGYEYRFVVDGRWVTDARSASTVPNPFGELNSYLVVTEPERTPVSRNSPSEKTGSLLQK